MNTNNTQSGHSPSEELVRNNVNKFYLDSLLPTDILTTSQPSSSTIQFNRTDMIVNNIEQHAHRGQQIPQVSRQGEQREGRRQLQQQEQYGRQRRRRERNQRQCEERHQHRFEQWGERLYQAVQEQEGREEQLYQRWQEQYRREQQEQEHYAYLQQRSPTFNEDLDEIFGERELEEYHAPIMTPEERQAIWEQEHLNEWQGNHAPRPHRQPPDKLEGYAIFLRDQYYWDGYDQMMQINDMENNEDTEESKKNEELLKQKEEWEETAFRLQQQQ